MNKDHKSHTWAIIFVFLFLVFAIPTSAQDPCGSGTDPNSFPFDFSDQFYFNNGVVGKAIKGRRTGSDEFSVWQKPCDPKYAPVRVLVNVPGYDQFGQPLFWAPLGDLNLAGFTTDKKGIMARQLALQFPMYIFPDRRYWEYSPFKNGRQAPVLDNSRYMQAGIMDPNPLGLRYALIVSYTEKAFSKEGIKVMGFFAEKNGLASDDTPILKSLSDITFMLDNKFIIAEPYNQGDSVSEEIFSIAPNMANKNSVAPDAFVWMVLKDGKPLPAEMMFWVHFDCMKKTGEMCKSEMTD